LQVDGSVVGAGHNALALNHDRPDGDFSFLGRPLGLAQS
jgi:hypothetical protein